MIIVNSFLLPIHCFFQRNLIREATAFLLDVLKPNLPEHGFLQTKVFLTPPLYLLMLYDFCLYNCTHFQHRNTFFYIGPGNQSGNFSKCS
jgi:hypothetical protein